MKRHVLAVLIMQVWACAETVPTLPQPGSPPPPPPPAAVPVPPVAVVSGNGQIGTLASSCPSRSWFG